MKKPIILTIDDDAQVLAAISRDLRQEFRKDYRVLSVGSGAEALATLAELHGRAEPLALVLADQRMPEVEGVEVLTRARSLFPSAKRVLLTAYADTTAAIQAINSAQLDYYLLKPWDPPEQLLYPTLHDLLARWQETYRPQFDGLRLVGFQWSPRSHELKDFLSGYMVGYQWLDFEKDADAAPWRPPTASGPPTCPWLSAPTATPWPTPTSRLWAATWACWPPPGRTCTMWWLSGPGRPDWRRRCTGRRRA